MPRKRLYKTRAEKREAKRLKAARYYARNKDTLNAKRRKHSAASKKFSEPTEIPTKGAESENEEVLSTVVVPSSSTPRSQPRNIYQRPCSPNSPIQQYERHDSPHRDQDPVSLHPPSSPDPLDVIHRPNRRPAAIGPENSTSYFYRTETIEPSPDLSKISADEAWQTEAQACLSSLTEVYQSVGASKRHEFLPKVVECHLRHIQNDGYNELIFDKHEAIWEIELRIIRLHERIYFRLPIAERSLRRLRDRVTVLREDLGSMILYSPDDLANDFNNGCLPFMKG
ncbi:hypothetical protein VNI00_007347 [Paramarasmius palmivorus]|uniref:Uncharacterized protein n=1 Tax=Paramarasmius palmivorus TaxID=297713 RepID=A0AAW0D4C6_9AGAR